MVTSQDGGADKIGEGVSEVQTSSCKTHKSWLCNVPIWNIVNGTLTAFHGKDDNWSYW